jgi:hypothetical protein
VGTTEERYRRPLRGATVRGAPRPGPNCPGTPDRVAAQRNSGAVTPGVYLNGKDTRCESLPPRGPTGEPTMTLRALVSLLFASAVLLGCDAKDKPFKDYADGELAKVLTAEEAGLVMSYVARTSFANMLNGDAPAFDSTISPKQMIRLELEARHADSVKVEQDKREAEAAAARRAAEIAHLRSIVTVIAAKKGFRASNYRAGIYDDAITFTFIFRNSSDRDIAGVKGSLAFQDMFGDEIHGFNISYDKSIPSGGTAHWSAQIEYNEFIDAHRRLRAAELDRVKQVWEPAVIVFADGTTVRIEPD